MKIPLSILKHYTSETSYLVKLRKYATWNNPLSNFTLISTSGYPTQHNLKEMIQT